MVLSLRQPSALEHDNSVSSEQMFSASEAELAEVLSRVR